MLFWLLAAGDSTIIDIATRGGPIAALLAAILYGGFKNNPWWVFGWVYRDLELRHKQRGEESNDWRDLALEGTHIASTLAKRERARGE